MKISKQAWNKATEIQNEWVKASEKEMEDEAVKSFAKRFGICPQCAIPLKEVKPKFKFFLSAYQTTKKKCSKCGFEIVWEETYY